MRSPVILAFPWLFSKALLLALTGTAQAEAPIWTDRPVRIDREHQHLERIPSRSTVASAAPKHHIDIGHDLKVIDAANFTTGGIAYRIVGIAGLKANEICRDKQGRRWACGVRSRATLRSLLKRRYLAARCTVQGAEISPIEVVCTYSNEDVGDYLVARGLAVRLPE